MISDQGDYFIVSLKKSACWLKGLRGGLNFEGIVESNKQLQLKRQQVVTGQQPQAGDGEAISKRPRTQRVHGRSVIRTWLLVIQSQPARRLPSRFHRSSRRWLSPCRLSRRPGCWPSSWLRVRSPCRLPSPRRLRLPGCR